ncbi:hypothetical protein PABG_06597 [Paracoccidioides brasiliensis Pb03]|nr:hypothetical protein PABG_06597 [Paracoccidioides brasiliensis Pb03]
MARLNEIPVAAESVESLKRRFIRQNREIARANSMQSLRIRTLESEVSRLLAENVTLREEVISANQELEKFQHHPHLNDEIGTLKAKLDAKLAEFGSLIADLGSLPRRRELLTGVNQMPIERGFQISPEISRRRSLVKAARETMDEDRLPAILEDKFYRRLSLDSADAAELENEEHAENEENDSPVPSSSPIFQPELQLHKPADSSVDKEPHMIFKGAENPIDYSESISNSGARRKRRDSSVLNTTPRSAERENRDQAFVPIHISKSGSKRKLSVRDDEELVSHDLDDHDDFQYTRIGDSSNHVSRDSVVESESTPTKATTKKSGTQRKERTAVRRALGPKTANTKQRSSTTEKVSATGNWEKETPKPNPKPPKNRSHDIVEKSIPTVPIEPVKQKKQEVVDINLWPKQLPVEENQEPLPKAHAGLDTSYAVPTDSSETRETPALPHSRMSRPPRRSRGSVSYAEPNLRDKMRRPTKELVDAVTGEARFRRASKSEMEISKDRNSEGSNHSFGMTSSATDGESMSSMTYNDSCAGLLGGTDDNSMVQLPSNVMTNRKRRTLSANKFDLETTSEGGPSTSSVAISTLMAGSKRRSNRTRDTSEVLAEQEQNVAPRTTTCGSRRQSSNSTTVETSSRSRRSQSSTNLSNENVADIQATLESAGISTNSRRGEDNHHSFSSHSQSAKHVSEFDYDAYLDAQESVNDVKRVQRLAESRRRSMML